MPLSNTGIARVTGTQLGWYPNNVEGIRTGDVHILLALAVQEVKFPFLKTTVLKGRQVSIRAD